MKDKEIKKVVREGYTKVAKKGSSCCVPDKTCCSEADVAENIGESIGYTEEEISSVPEDANLGLGCGNPVALASLKEDEVVLDLGSGAGFDCFLAAKKVGKKGKVIGVDMTPEMIVKAKNNARKGGYENVDFKLAEIENIPVAGSSVDIVISNCVINLSPDKGRVFREAFRVLKPGGRLMIADVVLAKELPDSIKQSVEAYIGCVSGAMMRNEYLQLVKAAGFQEVKVIDEKSFPVECLASDPTVQAIIENLGIPLEEVKKSANSIASIKVYGVKPDKET